MIIRCPSCSTTYKVDGSVLDAPSPTFRCSRCKHIFAVQVRLHLRDEEPLVATTETDPTPEANEGGENSSTGEPDIDEDSYTQERAETHGSPTAGEEPASPDPEAVQGTLGLSDASRRTEPEPAARASGETEVADSDADETAFSFPDFKPLADPDPPDVRGLEPFERTLVIEDDDVPIRGARQPDFEIDDDFLIPPKREESPPPPARTDAKGSIVPLASLVGLALFAFVLVTLIYQVNPNPLDSLLRRIPWYGATVFEDRHFKSTLAFESLVSGVQPVLNQTEVFVVSGKLVNRNDQSIHRVRIEAQLFDAEGKQVGRQVTFVGNAISAKIIQDMTFREISLLQSLKPQSAYRIPANQSATFTIVFPKPEAAVESFSCRVLSAEAPA